MITIDLIYIMDDSRTVYCIKSVCDYVLCYRRLSLNSKVSVHLLIYRTLKNILHVFSGNLPRGLIQSYSRSYGIGSPCMYN